MNKQPHTIHPFYTDPDAKVMYAVFPDDDTRGYVIGEMWEVQALYDKLGALLADGTDDGEVNHLHHQFGFKWLTTNDAIELIADTRNETMSRAMITHACRAGKIPNAVKAGRDWQFPQMSFLNWYSNRDGPGPKKKNST